MLMTSLINTIIVIVSAHQMSPKHNNKNLLLSRHIIYQIKRILTSINNHLKSNNTKKRLTIFIWVTTYKYILLLLRKATFITRSCTALIMVSSQWFPKLIWKVFNSKSMIRINNQSRQPIHHQLPLPIKDLKCLVNILVTVLTGALTLIKEMFQGLDS
jgi:hypothetical protein